MGSNLDYAVGRLRSWIRDFGQEKQPAFIADLQAVLDGLAAATAERDTARDDGRRAGLEQGAGIANDWAAGGSDDDWNKGWVAASNRIAIAIRAERDRLAGAGATELAGGK